MADIEALDTFNSTVKKLVRFASSKSKKLYIGGAVKKLKLLLDDAPLSAITVLGPSLAKHRDRVMVSDEKYFMESDFSSDIPDEFTADRKDIIMVITKLKKIYAAKCKPDEKKSILTDMKHLLVSYDLFVAHSK